jgi:hypothetical protein
VLLHQAQLQQAQLQQAPHQGTLGLACLLLALALQPPADGRAFLPAADVMARLPVGNQHSKQRTKQMRQAPAVR